VYVPTEPANTPTVTNVISLLPTLAPDTSGCSVTGSRMIIFNNQWLADVGELWY